MAVCVQPGCPELVAKGYCPKHKIARSREYEATRPTAAQRGYDADWRTVRAYVLERDEWQCQIRGPRCRGIATTVDHRIPLARGGARLDPSNLRAACARCNYALAGAMTRKDANR